MATAVKSITMKEKAKFWMRRHAVATKWLIMLTMVLVAAPLLAFPEAAMIASIIIIATVGILGVLYQIAGEIWQELVK